MSILGTPRIPPGAPALTASERLPRACGDRHRSGEIAGKLWRRDCLYPRPGLGPIGPEPRTKLGRPAQPTQGRQSELVFPRPGARLLDAPHRRSRLNSPDVLDFVQALAAAGR